MHKIPHYIAIILLSPSALFAQNSAESMAQNFSSQSFLMQNKFLLNPTFTVVNETSNRISLLSRNSFIGFENSPELNILGYSGIINDNVGAGIGVYQQKIGILTNFGAVVNYAYRIKLNEFSALTLGFNFILNKLNLDRSKITSTITDPLIYNFQNNTTLLLQPALNYHIWKFDVGIYLRDFIDYNLIKNEFLSPFTDKSFSAHILYTQLIKSNNFLLKNSSLKFFMASNTNTESKLTGNILLDLPKFGWVQTGYDDFFGYSAGFGIQLSKKITISYVYETGKNDLGATNEIGLTYFISKKEKHEAKTSLLKKTTKKNSELIKRTVAVEDTLKNKKTRDLKKIITLTNFKNSTTEKIEVTKKSKRIPSGFYLVVNVFSQDSYANSFIKKLKKENLTPKYIIHPITKYKYVYIAYSRNKKEIKTKIKNHVNGKYVNEKWILQIEN